MNNLYTEILFNQLKLGYQDVQNFLMKIYLFAESDNMVDRTRWL